MAGLSHYYVDYGAGSDDTGTGAIGAPWKTIQKALDNAVEDDGVQVNIKAGTAQVLAASLDLTAYTTTNGATAFGDPLILRGYTSAANDGGIGEIDCGGNTMWAVTTNDNIGLFDLEIHTCGDNHAVVLDSAGVVVNCEIHAGASSPSGKYLLTLLSGFVIGCYLHDTGDGAARGISGSISVDCYNNYIVLDNDAEAAYGIYGCNTFGNIIVCQKTDQRAIESHQRMIGNIIYNTTAGATSAVRNTSSTYGGSHAPVINNIIVGFSGVGGIGVQTSRATMIGYNAFYNCTTYVSVTTVNFGDLTANDVALAADPFTDAANGDFSLTAAAKTALAAKGFPTSYLGAHANTVPNLNIGPIQMAAGGAAGGGRPAFGDRTGGKF
jgi:hypothetical protein